MAMAESAALITMTRPSPASEIGCRDLRRLAGVARRSVASYDSEYTRPCSGHGQSGWSLARGEPRSRSGLRRTTPLDRAVFIVARGHLASCRSHVADGEASRSLPQPRHGRGAADRDCAKFAASFVTFGGKISGKGRQNSSRDKSDSTSFDAPLAAKWGAVDRATAPFLPEVQSIRSVAPSNQSLCYHGSLAPHAGDLCLQHLAWPNCAISTATARPSVHR